MCQKNPGLGHKNFIFNDVFIKMHYLKNCKKWPKLRTRPVVLKRLDVRYILVFKDA